MKNKRSSSSAGYLKKEAWCSCHCSMYNEGGVTPAGGGGSPIGGDTRWVIIFSQIILRANRYSSNFRFQFHFEGKKQKQPKRWRRRFRLCYFAKRNSFISVEKGNRQKVILNSSSSSSRSSLHKKFSLKHTTTTTTTEWSFLQPRFVHAIDRRDRAQ